MTNTTAAVSNPPSFELRLGLGAWALFTLATCAYCLLHQAFVSAVTPDIGHTVILALREWGAWALLAPVALRGFRTDRAPEWGRALFLCILLALVAASLPLVVDQFTDTRSITASLALFWPRNFAMAVALLVIGRVFCRREVARPVDEPGLRDGESPATLMVSKGADQCLIQVDEIQHVSAAGNYVDICARDQRYLLRATLSDVQTLLPVERFVRIHRSHIVHVREIERIRIERSGSGTVHLRGGGKLAISRSYRAQLKRHQDALKASLH